MTRRSQANVPHYYRLKRGELIQAILQAVSVPASSSGSSTASTMIAAISKNSISESASAPSTARAPQDPQLDVPDSTANDSSTTRIDTADAGPSTVLNEPVSSMLMSDSVANTLLEQAMQFTREVSAELAAGSQAHQHQPEVEASGSGRGMQKVQTVGGMNSRQFERSKGFKDAEKDLERLIKSRQEGELPDDF